MKGFIIAIVILAGILVIGGGAVAYKFMESHDGDSAVNKVMDKVSNSGSSDVVKEEVKENGQAGSGSYRQVSYVLISTSVEGKVTCFKPILVSVLFVLSIANACSGIIVTPSGITILSSAQQPEKV